MSAVHRARFPHPERDPGLTWLGRKLNAFRLNHELLTTAEKQCLLTIGRMMRTADHKIGITSRCTEGAPASIHYGY